jgi:hypothetical protein
MGHLHRRGDWRHLGAQLETSPAVLAGASLLLLLNGRWRKSATVYDELMSLERHYSQATCDGSSSRR